MKNLFLILVLACTCTAVNAQQLPDFSPAKSDTKEAKIARANEAALQCARYILATPPDTTNTDRQDAVRYMLMWMTETEEYSFSIGVAVTKLYEDDKRLLPVILAGMTEYAMTQPADKDDEKKVLLNATKKLIGYVAEPANGIKPAGKLKEAIAANKKGKLEQYLDKLNGMD